ncbi:hypothetical protein DLAC_00052 [Tieghemostelium lacteum]|uniref:IPT/TIG domain-containing protein n=1 Tax=Tieghemostelium lacteum TaxID=361077 RepID=A0A152A905_TIELA|nr:hypothetical protein DLAC_00052 [Tieghemostelium lacteum]|eukprot:KYR02605.1 hypothetical protein DLAC_00052 [Tieghemostelium lacteum]
MINFKLPLLLLIVLISSTDSQITQIIPMPNTDTELIFQVTFNPNSPINITEIKTDFSQQSYKPTSITLGLNEIKCIVQLNPNSQTEEYTFIDVNHPNITPYKIIAPLNNKVNLTVLKQPKVKNETILQFSGLYFQPYPPNLYYLIITTTNLNNTRTLDSSKNEIEFLNSTTFQINVGESVGEIEYTITEKAYSSGTLKTTYQKPMISNITFESNEFTISGDNFGDSIYSNYSEIILNSVVQSQSNYQQDFDNNQIILQSNHHSNYSNKFQFEISIGNVSLISPFVFENKAIIKSISELNSYNGGDITIYGSKLNCKNENNSTTEVMIMIGNKNCSNASNLIENEFTSIKCSLPSGNEFDENLTINITIDSVQNQQSTIKFSYHSPSISNYQHIIDDKDDILILNGANFDDISGSIENSNITFNSINFNLKNLFINYTNNSNKSTIIIPLSKLKNNNNNLKNGDIQIHTPNNKTSNSMKIQLKPTIDQIQGKINKNGGLITIIGRYLNLQRFNNNNNNESIIPTTTISIINQNNISICNQIKQFNNISIICNHSPTDSINNNHISIIIDNQQSNNNINVQFQPPIIQSIEIQQQERDTTSMILLIKGENFGTDKSLIQLKIRNQTLNFGQFGIKEISFEDIQIEVVYSKFKNSDSNQILNIIVNNQTSNEFSFEVPTSQQTPKKSGLSVGIIIAIVFGTLAGVVAILVASYIYKTKLGKKKNIEHKNELKPTKQYKNQGIAQEENNKIQQLSKQEDKNETNSKHSDVEMNLNEQPYGLQQELSKSTINAAGGGSIDALPITKNIVELQCHSLDSEY